MSDQSPGQNAPNADAAADSTPRRRDFSLDEYYEGVRAADAAVLARALTLVESTHPRHAKLASALLAKLMPHTGAAVRVGISGLPGSGKSTLIEALGLHLVGLGKRVAVLAIDPTSGISGGSILGDKTRMPNLAADASALVRPSPSSGLVGGVAGKTRECMLVVEAAGYDVVIVETMGVGQSETMVANLTDCFVALMLPAGGDELQGIKRGLLELVDIVVVNKADGALREPAELAAHQFRTVFATLADRGGQREPPQVLTASALRQQGIEQLWQAIDERQSRLVDTNRLDNLRRQQRISWLWNTVNQQLSEAVQQHPGVAAIRQEIERQVLDGTLSTEAAAQQVLEAIGIERSDG